MRRANDAFEIGSFARAIHKAEARATRIIEISFSLSILLFHSLVETPHQDSLPPHDEEESVTDEGIVRPRRSNYVSSARGNAQYSNYPADEYRRLMRMYANNAATGREGEG